jgi:cell wall assembly regulator SMI1
MDPSKTITQLWNEIDVWFDQHAATRNIDARRPGASAEDIEGLERTLGFTLPADYRASLAIHDGGGNFESYEYLSTARVAATWSRWSEKSASGELANRRIVASGAHPRWWEDSWVPFAADSAGNLLCVDSASRCLVALETQDAQGAFVTKRKGFVDWLRAYRTKLVNGELEVDDEGFVGEPVLRPSVNPPADLPKPIELDYAASELLQAAIEGNDLERVKELLATVAPNTVLLGGRPPLKIAAEAGHLRIVEFLVERGEDVNVGELRGDRTPLFCATWGRAEKLDVVRYLLDHGAHVNALTRFDGTVLHSAVMWNQLNALELLLRHGADVTIKDANGISAVEMAKGRPSETLMSDTGL